MVPNLTIASVPPPEQVKADLAALYRQVRITRSLLRLSERIRAAINTGETPSPSAREGAAHAVPA